ncbi:class I SAM-dependent methyltransferase [uncultured Porphyromonas sp.]|uniref:class I SAM-dependent methyltransferase n=1 Tax=uncultured Porphyromonas sp. TaxID=159274 RepID=UPI0026340E10|nr:class I SAM-dependent methyltransferase [uncultured Porphyromonas sp.]
MIWDRVAGIYDLTSGRRNREVNDKMVHFIASKVKAEDVVLECACGTGLITQVIQPLCRQLIATDLSVNMLAQTRKKCGKASTLTVELADITHLQYPSNSFDLVIAGNIIHLLNNPKKALDELSRVCRDSGRIIVPTYVQKDGENPSLWIKLLRFLGIPIKNSFSFKEYQQLFKDAGYSDVTYTFVEGKLSCAIAEINNRKRSDL